MPKTLVVGAKPFIKWFGGKAGLIPQIKPFLPQVFNTYYEPFVGGGAMLFHLQPENSVISDGEKDLAIAYEVVRDTPLALLDWLHGFSEQDSEEFYYQTRDDYNSGFLLDAIKTAATLIYMNKVNFNGGFRKNRSGGFNVPYDKTRVRKANICDRAAILAASEVLQGTLIKSGDFLSGIEGADEGDFVYFDPPYHPVKKGSFVGYGALKFLEPDQIRLAETMRLLTEKGVQVMVSNSDTLFTRELYHGYNVHTIFARRSVNSKGCDRGKVSEILVTNY